MLNTRLNPCNQIGEERIFNFQAGNFNLILVSWTPSSPFRMYDSAKVHLQGFVPRLGLLSKATISDACPPVMGDVGVWFCSVIRCSFVE